MEYRYSAAKHFVDAYEDPPPVPKKLLLWKCLGIIVVCFQIPGVRYFHQDAKRATVDWENVEIIYMTDLLWDQPLRKLLTSLSGFI